MCLNNLHISPRFFPQQTVRPFLRTKIFAIERLSGIPNVVMINPLFELWLRT